MISRLIERLILAEAKRIARDRPEPERTRVLRVLAQLEAA